MSKYIDAAQAADIISAKTGIPLSDLVDIFADIPAVNVAEVIRCKNCKLFDGDRKHCRDWDGKKCGNYDNACGHCQHSGSCTEPDGYCYHAKEALK